MREARRSNHNLSINEDELRNPPAKKKKVVWLNREELRRLEALVDLATNERKAETVSPFQLRFQDIEQFKVILLNRAKPIPIIFILRNSLFPWRNMGRMDRHIHQRIINDLFHCDHCSQQPYGGNPQQQKRMPLVLDPESELDWISEGLSREHISSLMVHFDADKMSYHTISRLITSRTKNNNVEEVKKTETYPE